MQEVPNAPGCCFLDYTYCASENCKNKCGRQMSDAIKKEVARMSNCRIAFSDFCDENGLAIK